MVLGFQLFFNGFQRISKDFNGFHLFKQPRFYFCGCPTSRARRDEAADRPQCEWEPNERGGEDSAAARKSELGSWPDSPRERFQEAQAGRCRGKSFQIVIYLKI